MMKTTRKLSRGEEQATGWSLVSFLSTQVYKQVFESSKFLAEDFQNIPSSFIAQRSLDEEGTMPNTAKSSL
jgi:hypothetical protein